PQGSFLYNMGWGDAVIVSPKSADTNKEKPIGTGPFKFQDWVKGSSITLVKSDAYWGAPVSLDKAEFRIVPDAAAAVPALLSGDIQAFPFFDPDSVAQVKDDPRFHVVIGSTEGETILSINNKKPPLDYVDLTGRYPHDVAKAKELLKQAGLENGFKATLKLPPPSYARLGGEIIASELRDVGIDLEIVPVEWAQWLDQVFTKKDYDLTIVSHTEPNDIDIYSRKDYYFNYNNPAFDKVIADLNLTSDEAKRKELLGEAQKILADDAVVGFLYELPKVGVWDAKLQGLWENAPIQANDLTKVKWSE
ncbi:MAG: ABC transporter substrate-binding protein, partial [Mesorhizobium sp.]